MEIITKSTEVRLSEQDRKALRQVYLMFSTILQNMDDESRIFNGMNRETFGKLAYEIWEAEKSGKIFIDIERIPNR